MLVDSPLGLGHSTAVDDASVIELITDDQIPLIHQGEDCSRVRSITRLKRDRRFSPSIVGENLLELQVNIHGAGDDSYRSRPCPIFSRRSNRSLLQLRMIGQPEIVIGT